MNNVLRILMILSVSAAIVACKRDVAPANAEVTLEFRADFAGEELELFQDYINVTGYDQKVEQLKLYLSDISLVDVNGVERELSELEYFDYSSGSLQRSYSVPNGSFISLKCAIGVRQALNGTADETTFDPAVYPPEHPLALANNMYWAWTTGYRFLIYEGRVDATPTDPNDLPHTYSIHMGRDTTYLPLQFDFESTSGTSPLDIDLNLDVSKCIYNETDTLYLDADEDNAFHGQNIPLAMRFRTLLEQSLTVEVR